MQLEGKKLIVTGGARGLGASLINHLVTEGAKVYIMDLKDDLGAEVAENANAIKSNSAKYLHLDITKRGNVEEAFEKAVKDMGGLDIIINTVGVSAPETLVQPEDVNEDAIDLILNVNIKGTIIVNQIAFRYLKENGGAIINFGSDAATTIMDPANPFSVYGASKAALHSWTQTTAKLWGKHGIRVNAVLPHMFGAMMKDFYDSSSKEIQEEFDEMQARTVPLRGTAGDPDSDLAPAVIFLASDSASYITGQLFTVNGGFGMPR
ncbi:hypothetical protein CHH69_17940 [Terribacillus saccharophilus]|uniref:SDR family NAD(P)-dependent oxidoreductase n=1 Tax=Terribacillus saccharophilus TaxID=361277 RepID=UPI000BA79843|nr:SDR family oxidoreductase [Terribacillus saccharophilus]PAF34045.1 hypothetical protein CHH69_17940 [Terribacillus saccharophilus]